MSTLCWNGVDARTGGPLLAAMSPGDVSAMALAQTVDAEARRRPTGEPHLGVRDGVDPADLAQAGWALIMPLAADSGALKRQGAIREALQPLLSLRRAQATRIDARLYRELCGADGVRPGETKVALLRRLGLAPGAVDPTEFPYYALLVGEPAALSWTLQHHLGVQRAVGRLAFDTVDEYAHYAQSVVRAERDGAGRRAACFFGARNPDDVSTRLSAGELVEPLAAHLAGRPEAAGWTLDTLIGADATRGRLIERLETAPPALLFAAAHGVGFPPGDPMQREHQGGLLCQDWPGPVRWGERPIDRGHWLAGEDLGDAPLLGTMAFLFACFGAGTPATDSFGRPRPQTLAPAPFVSRLAQRMLTAPRGGALAVVAHVDRAFGWSFLWPSDSPGGPKAHRGPFEDAVARLLAGRPVGNAVEPFPDRWAELTTDLALCIEDAEHGAAPGEREVAALWTASNDARSYAVIGDPACRLRPGGAPAVADARPVDLGALPPPPPRVPPPFELPSPLPHQGEGEDTSGLMASLRDAIAALGRGVADATSLEVRTWVAPDPGALDHRQLSERATLRAWTRTAVDGDTDTCVAADARPDEPALALHGALVEQAQAHRAQLLQTLTTLLRSLG